MTIQRTEEQRLALPNLTIARGEWRGYSTVFKFGFNADVSTTEETVWFQGGAYTHPSSASTMTVSSSDANDTSAGTGARTVQVYGLDGNYDEINETVTLSGQTGVSTSNSYLRVNRMVIRSAGSGETNAGVVYMGTGTVTSGVPANIYSTVGAGFGQTLQTFWTVPNRKTLHLNSLSVSSFGNSNAYVTCSLVVRPQGEVFQVKERFVVTRGTYISDLKYPVAYPSKADVEIRAVASSGTLDVAATFEGCVMGY